MKRLGLPGLAIVLTAVGLTLIVRADPMGPVVRTVTVPVIVEQTVEVTRVTVATVGPTPTDVPMQVIVQWTAVVVPQE